MKLTAGNTYIVKNKNNKYELRIEMPDGSRNYIHCQEFQDLDSAILIREIIEEQDIDYLNLRISYDEEYYRLYFYLNNNDDIIEFHSRKLNLNDVIYERMQLLVAEYK